jgi:hypothetical protein
MTLEKVGVFYLIVAEFYYKPASVKPVNWPESWIVATEKVAADVLFHWSGTLFATRRP